MKQTKEQFVGISYDELLADNAKLRELCGDMLLYIAYPYVCVRPSVLVERARELRVEVDE